MNVWKLENDTAMDRIRMHYLSGYELSAHDEEVKRRWHAAFTFGLEHKGSDKEVASMLTKTFNISESQAYRDIYNAINLFGDVRKSTKEGLRYMVTQWAIEVFKMAVVKKDFKGMEKALTCITKTNNLDKEDQDLPDPSKIQPPVQMLSLSINFVNSPYFKLIDDKAQKEILAVVERIQLVIDQSPVKNYLDMLMADVAAAESLPDGRTAD